MPKLRVLWMPLLLLALEIGCGSETDDRRAEGGSANTQAAGTGGSQNAQTGGSIAAGTPGGGSNGAALGGRSNEGAGTTSGGASSGGGAVSAGGDGNSGSENAGSGGAANAGAPGQAGAPALGGQSGLPDGIVALFPAPNATSVCPDPTLRIRFAAAPALGTAGKIEVSNASGTVVASVDMARTTVTDTIGGMSFTLQRPAFVDGNEVVIGLKNKALAYGQTYSVTVEGGAIRPAGNVTFAVTDKSRWRFTTSARAPADLSAFAVAVDGTAPFCSVQGATDALPANNTAPALITIGAGIYHELILVSGKRNVTLRGTDRKRTIIQGTNNDKQNPGTKQRALVGFDDTNGLVIENLTIHNLTPQGGSQAEALRLQGCDQCIVRDADLLSLQDTLLFRGRIYVKNSYIAGNVDYIWGDGVAYFDGCEIHTVGRTGVIVQSRNAASAYGFVFVDSKLTADAVATNNMLARIDASAYPGSHVAYIDCQMSNIAAAGWTITGGSPPSSLRFWEYQSRDVSGNALNVAGRLAGSTRLSSAQAAMMRDKATVLGGWTPN